MIKFITEPSCGENTNQAVGLKIKNNFLEISIDEGEEGAYLSAKLTSYQVEQMVGQLKVISEQLKKQVNNER